eukprot:jgi/Hompol1/3031/HPOL_003101-RA
MLAQQEAKVVRTVIKMGDAQQHTGVPLAQRQSQFLTTVAAVREIVVRKLHHASSHPDSVEAYFNRTFSVSRAQVYRIMDCWPVLEVSPFDHALAAQIILNDA